MLINLYLSIVVIGIKDKQIKRLLFIKHGMIIYMHTLYRSIIALCIIDRDNTHSNCPCVYVCRVWVSCIHFRMPS